MPPADEGNGMALTDLAKTEPARARKGPECEVCDELAKLPPEQAAALEELLANKRWRYSEIAAKVAKDEDHPLNIAAYTYSRHAKGECWAMRQAGRKLR